MNLINVQLAKVINFFFSKEITTADEFKTDYIENQDYLLREI